MNADIDSYIPKEDRNGNAWSDEQMSILRTFTEDLMAGKARLAVPAVAGSGKTSLLQGMIEIVARLCPEQLTCMTAFNTHIASSSKDILLKFKRSHGLNVKVFGSSNTVNAGGHQLLMKKAEAEGFDGIELKSYGDDRYTRIARLTLAGWLARQDRLPLMEMARSAMEVKTTSHAFNNMIGEGLVKACNIVMDEGFIPTHTLAGNDVGEGEYVPPVVHSADVKEVQDIISRVGANQSWEDNPARNLGDTSVFELVVEILAVAIETAFLKVELKPFCGVGKSFMDALVPFKKAERKGGWEVWQDLKPVRDQIFTSDPNIIKSAQFAILENGGCRFPPASKQKSSVKAVSFDTDKKAILRKHKGHIIMSFENGGHLKKIGGKGIGTQFGKKGNHKVNGEFISTWRRFDPSLGMTVVFPQHVEKVVALLTEKFGAEFENQLDDATESPVEMSMGGGKGSLVLSMDDQIYLPHALNLSIPEHEKASIAFIDEGQDLSVLKAQLVWRLVKEDATKVMVADNRQAIYLFAGASATAFEDNVSLIGAKSLEQTISWRGTEMVASSARYACRQFVEIAREYWSFESHEIPDYQAHRSPLEAGYDWWPMGAMPSQITPDEIVKAYHKSIALHGEDTTFGLLCRVKKPLADYIKLFIKAGIPVSTPSGKDGLVAEAFKMTHRARSKVLDESWQKVNAKAFLGLGWLNMPVHKIGQASLLLRDIEAMKKAVTSKFTDMFKGDTKSMAMSTEFQEMQGNLELLEAFVSLFRVKGNADSVKGDNLADALKNWVQDTLFSDRGGNAVHIATIHRYKGDEADVMFIVNEMLVEDDDGEKAVPCFMNNRSCEASLESTINEISMGYVAFTRAKKQNLIINAEVSPNLCRDVSQRLEGAFHNDVEMMTTNYAQEPQESSEDTPGDNDDLDRCGDCSTIIADGEPHGTCCECGVHLCREYVPDHHTNGGSISDIASCGSYVGNLGLAELFSLSDDEKENFRLCEKCQPADDVEAVEVAEDPVDVRFESVDMGISPTAGTRYDLMWRVGEHKTGVKLQKVMRYRHVEGRYIQMSLKGEELYWVTPDDNDCFSINEAVTKSPIQQTSATFYLNRLDQPVDDIHALVVGLFKKYARTMFDGGWMNDPKPAIQVLLKEDA